MARIFTFIFSILAVTHAFPESISKRDLADLKQKCITLYNEKQFPESIPMLEKYLSYRDEVRFKIYLAKAILFRKDLPEPLADDEIFVRQDKISNAVKNYNRASKIFSEVIIYLEKTTPNDKSIADLYFLWAFSEYFGENKEKAISLFKKSSILNPELKSMANYNIASLYEDLGQIKDSRIYFNK